MTARREEIRRRLLLRLFGSPLTLLPLVGGAGFLLSPLFFAFPAAIPAFLGITTLAFGGAGVGIRWMKLKDRISQEVLEEMELEAIQVREARLNALLKRLEADGDPRTDGLLRDVQQLVGALKQDAQWRDQINVVAAGDILAGIDELFTGSVERLTRSVELFEMAQGLSTTEAREQLLGERERSLAEVQQSVKALSALVGDLRVLASESADAGPNLDEIQLRLRTSLKAARLTERETSGLQDEERVNLARRQREKER